MIKNYNKKIIVKNLSVNTGFSVLYSQKLIDDLLKCMILTISSSSLSIKNFGTFQKSFKKDRIGRNPKTKKEFIIKSRNVIKFTPSKKLLFKINTLNE